MTTAPRAFAEVSALSEDAAGGFVGDIDPEWTIGGKPNGGYLLAMLARAAVSVTAHKHVVAASVYYLHSPEPGPVAVSAEVLRAGRSASHARIRMVQDGTPCIEALATVTDLDPNSTPYWSAGLPEPVRRPQADCFRIPSTAPNGLHVAIMDQVDLRIDPDDLSFAGGTPSGRGVLRGWLALPHGANFDPVSLLYALDAFPPATLDIELTGWVPTLELTAYVRALPAPGPVRVLQKAQLIDGAKVDEVCYVWDSAGRLVAQGTQLAGIRLRG